MLYYELPISKNVVKAINEADKTRECVLFKLANEQYSDTLFLLAHGNDEGRMSIHGYMASSIEVLEVLTTKQKIQEKGITNVVTISCYGGVQESCELNGVKISSFHNYNGPIYRAIWESGFGDEFALDIHIPEEEIA